MDRYQDCAQLLDALESALKSSGYWSMAVPVEQAFASSMPFCVDTMSLPQWLQFIFLPKMHEIVRRKLPLPQAAGITEYAEECFKDRLETAGEVLKALKQLDEFFTQGSVH